jgi:hypothetical protein
MFFGLTDIFFLPITEVRKGRPPAMSMKENQFQGQLIKELKAVFPGCVVLKNDANYLQGFPDLLVLYEDKWAALECKRADKAHRQPNQTYYVDTLNKMSYASFICPENRNEVMNELQQTFRTDRSTRISGCE